MTTPAIQPDPITPTAGQAGAVALADPILDAGQVAGLLGLTCHAIKHLHRTHALRGFCIARKLRFRLSAVERYIAAAEGKEDYP